MWSRRIKQGGLCFLMYSYSASVGAIASAYQCKQEALGNARFGYDSMVVPELYRQLKFNQPNTAQVIRGLPQTRPGPIRSSSTGWNEVCRCTTTMLKVAHVLSSPTAWKKSGEWLILAQGNEFLNEWESNCCWYDCPKSVRSFILYNNIRLVWVTWVLAERVCER